MFSRLFRRGHPAPPAIAPPAIAPGYDLLESVTNAANAAANKFVSSNAYKTALNNANSNESKMAGVVGRKAMKEVANKIAYKSRNLTQKVNQVAQNPTPANASQVVTAANGLQQAVQQANTTVVRSNTNAAVQGRKNNISKPNNRVINIPGGRKATVTWNGNKWIPATPNGTYMLFNNKNKIIAPKALPVESLN
jgi:hypothetical protein